MKTFRFQVGNVGIRVKNPDMVKRIANRTYVVVGDIAVVIADNSFSILSREFVEQLADFRVAKPI